MARACVPRSSRVGAVIRTGVSACPARRSSSAASAEQSCVMRVRSGTREPVSQADVGAVGRTPQKLRGDEAIQHPPAGLRIEAPKPLRLRAREAQPWHFEELAADTLQREVVL